VLNPVPGTFLPAARSDSDAFVEPGGEVATGDTVGLVEIMKNFQNVEAEVAGTLVEFPRRERGRRPSGPGRRRDRRRRVTPWPACA
jgi:acetyl-CoA carboxylase biotin carboxyl carrier protein